MFNNVLENRQTFLSTSLWFAALYKISIWGENLFGLRPFTIKSFRFLAPDGKISVWWENLFGLQPLTIKSFRFLAPGGKIFIWWENLFGLRPNNVLQNRQTFLSTSLWFAALYKISIWGENLFGLRLFTKKSFRFLATDGKSLGFCAPGRPSFLLAITHLSSLYLLSFLNIFINAFP